MKKPRLLGAACAFLSLVFCANVSASIVINIIESGGNVEASYSGFLDLSATTGVPIPAGSTGFNGHEAWSGAISFTSGLSDIYGVDFASWTPFGTGNFGAWDASSGDALHLQSNPLIGVPNGYISGANISGNATKNGSSFASLGFTPGSYVSTLTNGSNVDTVTVNIGAVPVPAAVWLFGSGLLGLVGMAKRKKAV